VYRLAFSSSASVVLMLPPLSARAPPGVRPGTMAKRACSRRSELSRARPGATPRRRRGSRGTGGTGRRAPELQLDITRDNQA
jgi:hypothetical protein